MQMELTSSSKRRVFAASAATVLAALTALVALDGSSKADPPTPATSVVLISGDGMGIQQRTAIQYAAYGLEETQPMDALPVAGFLDTIPFRKAVSDSAAGATAWSIGMKTKNGLVGIGPNGETPPTLMEIAKDQGKATGLVNDHDITNATLAAFASPVENRDHKVKIARRTLHRIAPDVMMGGNERYWYPEGDEGMIPDEVPDEDRSIGRVNLVEEAQDLGYEYAYDRETVDALTGPKALALVQDSGIQRWKELKGYKAGQDPYYVPAADLLAKSLELLSQDPDGFFLVAESDDLDSAGHEHDGRAVIRTGKTVNDMVEVVQEFRETHPDVLLIVTADHETGGMTIENKWETNTNSDGDDPVPYYGDGSRNFAGPNGEVPPRSGPFKIKGTNREFKVDWTTPEHTGGMVPVTAVGPLSELFSGVHQNTHVFDVAQQALLAN
jgi:alkaline phosphatase